MKIKEKLETIHHYYVKNRQAGHTSLMRNGVLHTDKKLVLVHKPMSDIFGCKNQDQVSWHSLHKLIGQDKPLAIDNGVMTLMLQEAIEEIERLEEDSLKLQRIKGILK